MAEIRLNDLRHVVPSSGFQYVEAWPYVGIIYRFPQYEK
jgi:hypothetical protein